MHPSLTYELRVAFRGDQGEVIRLKETLVDWLLLNGIDSFVEGTLDVDINQNQDEPPRDHYTEMGGDLSPVSIYRYSREALDDLQAKLEHAFGSDVEVSRHAMPTEAWMEGWKESFKPFATEVFYVRPPWEPSTTQGSLIDLVIEPGMAFGTGQHATTRLCLELLHEAMKASPPAATARVLDVGTGTGILAIGARKLGFGQAIGTDIEDDAVLAAGENARLNQVTLDVRIGSIPAGESYELVFANILAVVLIRLMRELAAATTPGGQLILSGILVEEEDEVAKHGVAAGLTLTRRARHEGWSALLFEKPRG